MSQRVVLGCCALGLALLAGCNVSDDDPPADPPGNPPDAAPPDAALPDAPPPDAAPPLPPDAGPPPPLNAPGDEYDVANNRLLVPDCANDSLLSLDLATGERSVLVDTWPWTEPGSTSCVSNVMVDPSGARAFATVSRSFQDPDGSGLSCGSKELVSIDTATGVVTLIENITLSCSDDDGTRTDFDWLQVDALQERLLYINTDCSPDFCHYYVAGTPFGASQREVLHTLYTPDCYPDDEGCSGDTWVDVTGMSFDPADPDHRLLVMAQRYRSGEVFIDSLDVATGTLERIADIQPTLGDLTFGAVYDFAVDVAGQRVLLAASVRNASGQALQVVIAIDRATGEHSLLHDGSPTADGQQLICGPRAAFDASARRLLLFEPLEFTCKNGAFALDVETGAFTLVADRVD